MSRRWSALVFVFLPVAACGGETLELTETDSLGQFSIEDGDTVEIVLEENPSTGFVWEPVAIPEMLTLSSDEYVEPDNDLVGAPGSHVFLLTAGGEGAGIVRLEYVRPFDDPIVPERVVEYIVIVGDASWPPDQGGQAPGTSGATAP
jgi:predicted secreted protein